MLCQKEDEIAIPVNQLFNLCKEAFLLLFWDDRKQGQRANLGGDPLSINGDDIHDGDAGLVLQDCPRMGGGFVDEGTALSEERIEGCRRRCIQVPMHARCQLLEPGLGIGILRQKAEEQVAHLPVTREHLLMGLLEVLEPRIGRLSQLYPAFG